MPELRKDPVVGRWVIIATERARRPGNFVDTTYIRPQGGAKDCQFCHPSEKIIYSAKKSASSSNWDVCVTDFKESFLNMNEPIAHKRHGLYEVVNGVGTHEVVIETSTHVANMADLGLEQIRLIFETYAGRITELEKNPQLQYVLPYKNYSQMAGSRMIGHTRSHIIATPVNPVRVNEKLTGAKEYFDTKKRCIYCDLIKQDLEEKSRIVVETEHFLAVIPFAARFLFETWILPKKHHCDYASGVKGVEGDLALMMKTLLTKFKVGLDDPAYNYVIHTAPFRRMQLNTNRWATIEQDFHWHMELMPQLTLMAGFEKGTGFYICAVPPEQMAEYLREIII